MGKGNAIFKSLAYSYLATLGAILLYNLLLTFTSVSGNTIPMAAASITTIASAYGGFYASVKIKEKGLIYGMLVGLLYITFMLVAVFLANDAFKFEMSILYKMLLTIASGGIGGILGVNFK